MANLTNSGPWLTPKRLRAHGTILALCLWSVYLWNVSTPGLRDRTGNLKGTDFLHFYTLGSLAAEHRGADLYEINTQAALAAQRVPAAAGIRYLPLYPPQVSIFFAPLAGLSYGWALTLWLSFCVLIYGVCCNFLWRACPNLSGNGWTVAILAVAFPGFFHLIAWGQTSALALACFTLAFFLLRNQKKFLAGLAIGCLIFKPQLGLAAAVLFLTIGAWRVIGGALLSAVLQLSVGWIYYGTAPLREWAVEILQAGTVMPLLEPKVYQTHSLRTFWTMLVPWPHLALALYAVSALAVLGLTLACWKRNVPLGLRYSSLLLATVLVSPHLTVYDLVILAPAFLLLADWLVAQPRGPRTYRIELLLYLAFVLPLLGPLDTWTHLRLSVIAMCLLLYTIWKNRFAET